MTALPLLDVPRFEARLRPPLLRPPKRLSLSAWADEHFRLPAGDANAGRWRTLPYQRGILDAMSDPEIEQVTIMKSARVGYTKSFCAAVGYFIQHEPSPILVVQPTLDDARKHSKEDLAPMLRDVPVLRRLAAGSRESETILEKLFVNDASLSLIGANSPRGFRRTGRRVVIFDEVDGYPESAGKEGDQIALGIARTRNFWNRKIILGSTPTIEDASRIAYYFTQGDQRRYFVPCPVCGAYQVLKFPNLKWEADRPETAYFQCESEGCRIEPRHKGDMIAAGEWRAEAPEHFTPDTRHASFHVWAAYSYSPHTTWADLAREFLAATRGGALLLKTFINTVLGETWQERGEAPAYEPIMRRREPYAIGTVPAGALFLTAGVDVQKDRLVYEVVGWGRGKTSWSIDAGVLPGDPARLDGGPWPALDAILDRGFPHEAGAELQIARLAIDAGFHTQHVYSWAIGHDRDRVIAVRGVARGPLIGTPSPVEVSRAGRRLKRGGKSWPVCGDVAKRELYSFLGLERPLDGGPPPPGYCHFPEYGEDYFRELTGEQLLAVKRRGGFPVSVWALIPGRTNHALDARVYARAAASSVGLDRFREADWSDLEARLGVTPTPEPPPPVVEPLVARPEAASPPARARRPWGGRDRWLGRRDGGWLR